MKKLLIAATALSLMAAPAFAAPTTASIVINGSVTAKCDPTGAIPALTVTIPGDLSTNTGGLNAGLINALTGSGTGTGVCNGVNTTYSITATPLTGSNVPSAAAIAAGFTNIINYQLALSLTGYASGTTNPTYTVNTGTPLTGTLGLANVTGGSFDVNGAALPSGASILVAGAYTSTVTLTVTPS